MSQLRLPDAEVIKRVPFRNIEPAVIKRGSAGDIFYVGCRGNQYYLFPVQEDGTIPLSAKIDDEFPYPNETANIVDASKLGVTLRWESRSQHVASAPAPGA